MKISRPIGSSEARPGRRCSPAAAAGLLVLAALVCGPRAASAQQANASAPAPAPAQTGPLTAPAPPAAHPQADPRAAGPVAAAAAASDDDDAALWRIPVQFAREFRDLRAPGRPNANLAAHPLPSETDDEPALEAPDFGRPRASGSSPTVISASTSADLKTAAGYHYPTHDGYHHHHEPEPAHHHGPEPGYQTAAAAYGPGHHHYGKYFQYASSPYPYAWDAGYRRGNPYHTIERYEHAKGPHFQTKVKWSDKYGGQGVHVWDYNHDDHSGHHYGPAASHYDDNTDHHGHHNHHHYAAYPAHHLGAPNAAYHHYQPALGRRA